MLFRSSFSVVCVVAVAALLAPASVDGAKKKKPSAPHKVPIKQGDVTYECPHGYELQGKHECVKILSAEMQPVCPHGTMLKADECVEKTDLIYKCPAGYATTSDKTSHNHHSSSHNRNHGGKKDDHHKDTTSCYKLSRSAPVRNCPHGTQPSPDNAEFCMKAISFLPEKYCPVGGGKGKGSSKGDQCVEYKPVAPVGSCRKGFTMQHGTCVGTESYSCAREVVCVGFGCAGGKGKEQVGKKDGHHHHVESHHGKKRRSLEESAVSRQLKKKKDDKDDKKPFDAVRQQYGSSSHGEKKKETSCYKPVSVALLQDCGHGVYDGSSGKCVEHSITESLQSCPALYELCGQKGGRKLYGKETEESKGKVEAPPSCCRMEFAIPQPVCHHGYTQQAHHCVRSSEPKMKCPHGYVSNNGSCTQELRKKPVQLYSVVMCKGKHCEAHGEKKHLRQ
eukprot:GHVS01047940.1.p1 GENE.GHVS01047940.1~~GHVS01047940.1.p1  ORF type:complete len:448 (+),score=113.27 GHVS01047940.1:152-1495(+)